ncbi:ACT domain-containing protein [Thermococcus nautili]|uniref:Acetolactate synthase, small (Regulatory) subunit n=1 Tax=Thermococcus nautili TaxID=195522 RepID=W8NVK6_9EURY|nr:ACT domain-containing protein [Thermococcus nautili]AHL23298.1 Acetolactate synthase, small (regulatory) subunit [Thermococcus nautili]CAI1493065.1 Acetolactate synthase, small (Regulatory) subunit [Thermococcus nautili]
MRHYEIVKIRRNGVVEIPTEYAYELGLLEGAYFLVEIDTDLKEVHLERIALPGKRLAEVELVVEDRPGVLAKISGLFGRHGVNILFSESEELSAIGLAGIVAVVDVSGVESLDDLRSELEALPEVKEVLLKPLD